MSKSAQHEKKWIQRWREARIYEANPDPAKRKFITTFPFPYQNGPLHIGHAFTAARADIATRFKRMQGYNALFPWSWHLTGEAVAGTADRLRKGDESVLKGLREIDGVPEGLLHKFVDPEFISRYYMEENRKAVDSLGLGVDWRREFYTTSLHPWFSRFIEWQYLRLRELGYVVQGTHPVVWCPVCESPTGDHDRLEGEGVVPEELVLVKFRLGDVFLVAASLRPETLFGCTNVWLNPGADYVEVVVGGERWVVSQRCAEKLREQRSDVEASKPVSAADFMGRRCVVPLTDAEVLILPATLVNPNVATGVVYSVPAHAPYDLAGLEDLKRKPQVLAAYGVDVAEVQSIQPISLIRVEGLGDFPAVHVNEQLGVVNQSDPKLEEATKIVYSKEFHGGVTKEICGEFAGLSVAEARDAVKQRLIETGLGDTMFELPERVVCRSGDECVVRVLRDQWFLDYSNPDWKARVKEHLATMNIYPEEARPWFVNVIDWYREWPCARKTGLGTPLPWDKSWNVETLSDSTVYNAFYTMSKFVNAGLVPVEGLVPEVFDYVFLGRGRVDDVAGESGLDPKLLSAMRDEFLYWYPVDLRVSAKELLPNHLTFFLFQHIALFEKRHWPKGISVNGMINIEGRKMSKSTGVFVPARVAVEKYGSDAVRCALILSSERMDDGDWREKSAEEAMINLAAFLVLVDEAARSQGAAEDDPMDRWLFSRLQMRIKQVTSALESMLTRAACDEAFYKVWSDWRWYSRRRSNNGFSSAAREFFVNWVKILSPFAPFTCEEAWSRLGEKGFVSISEWPVSNESKIDAGVEVAELYISKVVDDTRSILKLLRSEPKAIHIYTTSPWKRDVAKIVLLKGVRDLLGDMGPAIREAVKANPMRKKEVAGMVKRVLEVFSELPTDRNTQEWVDLCNREAEIMRAAAGFLSREFNCKILVSAEGETGLHDPMHRAASALPLRPAIYVET